MKLACRVCALITVMALSGETPTFGQEPVEPTGAPILPFLRSDYPVQKATCLTWSSDGKQLYVGARDGGVYCFRVSAGHTGLSVTPTQVLRWPLSRSAGQINSIAVHGRTGHVAIGGSSTFGNRSQIAMFSADGTDYRTFATFGHPASNRPGQNGRPRGGTSVSTCMFMGNDLLVVDDNGIIWTANYEKANGTKLSGLYRISFKANEPRTEIALIWPILISEDRAVVSYSDRDDLTKVCLIQRHGQTLQVSHEFPVNGRILDVARDSNSSILAVLRRPGSESHEVHRISLETGRTNTVRNSTGTVQISSASMGKFLAFRASGRLPDVSVAFEAGRIASGRWSSGRRHDLANSDGLWPYLPRALAAAPGQPWFAFIEGKEARICRFETDNSSPELKTLSNEFDKLDDVSLDRRSDDRMSLRIRLTDGQSKCLNFLDGTLNSDSSDSRLADRSVRNLYRRPPGGEGLPATNGLWKVPTTAGLLQFPTASAEFFDEVYLCTFGQHVRFLVTTNNGSIYVYRRKGENSFCSFVTSLRGHRGLVKGFATEQQKQILCSYDERGLVNLWDASVIFSDNSLTRTRWGTALAVAGQNLRITQLDSHSALRFYGWDEDDLLTQVETPGDGRIPVKKRGENALQLMQDIEAGARYALWTTEENQHDVTNVSISASWVPMLSFVFRSETNDWAAWTPYGDFDCSVGLGNRLFGWQFFSDKPRRDLERPLLRTGAELYDQFRRSGLIQQVLGTAPEQALRRSTRQILTANRALPAVRITRPAAGEVVGGQAVNIEAQVFVLGDRTINEFEVVASVNGRPLGQAVVVAGPESTSLRWTLQNPEQMNQVAVRLIDRSTGLYAETYSSFQSGSSGRYTPRAHLLTIAVEDYDNVAWSEAGKRFDLSSAFPDVRYARNDAQLIQELFGSTAAPSRPAFSPAIQSRQLGDLSAPSGERTPIFSHRNIEQVFGLIQQQAESYDSRDLFVLYVAGHGVSDVQTRGAADFYVVPPRPESTAHLNNPTGLQFHEASMISWKVFDRFLSSLPCRVLVLLDTCDSGAAAWDAAARTSDKRDIFLLTAAQPQERSFGYDKVQHSFFSWVLREAIVSGVDHDADGVIDLEDIARHTQAQVPALAVKAGVAEHTPMFKDFDGGASDIDLFYPSGN